MGSVVSRTLSVHIEHEFLLKLETAGLTDNIAQHVIDSKGNDLALKVVRFIEDRGFCPSTSQKRARAIMGRNFFGVEEAVKYFRVDPAEEQVVALSGIPFSETVLEEVKDTHILVAVFPLSILDIRDKVKERKFFWHHGAVWYSKEAFAREQGEFNWYLVRKTPVENSISKTWDKQQMLLEHNEKVPSARVCVYTIIGHFLASGERLFTKIYVRTSSVGSSANLRIRLGYFDDAGLTICHWWVDYTHETVGISSIREF